MPNKYRDIGDRIRKFGEDNFTSMVEFASYLEVSKANLNQYLQGKNPPGFKMLSRLLLLGCDLNWLLSGKHTSSIMEQLKDREKELERELLEKDKIISKVAEQLTPYSERKKKK